MYNRGTSDHTKRFMGPCILKNNSKSLDIPFPCFDHQNFLIVLLLIGDSESYLSDLIGATWPNAPSFVGTFLAGRGDTFLWLEINCFVFESLLHVMIYPGRWWLHTNQ